MSDKPVAVPSPPPVGSLKLWERQTAAIFAIELRKNFLSARALGLYLVAMLPLIPFPLSWLVHRHALELTQIQQSFGFVFQFLLRVVVYFGCAWLFTNLFRSEILDRSLHYYFLAPVRREVVAAGKYLAGTLGTMFVFCATTLATYLSLFTGNSPRFVFNQVLTGSGLDTLLAYLATTALACLGYGALFLLLGLLVRNPFVPVVLLWGWEQINYLLPAALKKLSVVYYLQSLSPVPFVDSSRFALLAEPVSPPVAVAGLTALSLVLLGAAALKLRRMEIAYGVA